MCDTNLNASVSDKAHSQKSTTLSLILIINLYNIECILLTYSLTHLCWVHSHLINLFVCTSTWTHSWLAFSLYSSLVLEKLKTYAKDVEKKRAINSPEDKFLISFQVKTINLFHQCHPMATFCHLSSPFPLLLLLASDRRLVLPLLFPPLLSFFHQSYKLFSSESYI